MFCTKCGSKLKENAKFCTKCGTPVKERAKAKPQNNSQEQRTKGQEAAQSQEVPQSQEVSQSRESQKRQEPQQMREPVRRQEPQKVQQAQRKAEGHNLKSETNISPNNKNGNKIEDKKDNSSKKGLVIFLGVFIGILVIGIIILSAILIIQKSNEATSDIDDTSTITESDMGDGDNQGNEIIDGEREIDQAINEVEPTEAETVVIETEEEAGIVKDESTETEPFTEPATEAVALGDYANNKDKINTYKIVISDKSWIEAYTEALEYENGYLVHINSQNELDYIVNQISAEGYENKIFWLGGMRSGNSASYNWVDTMGMPTGPKLNDEKFWMEGEPSFYDYTLEIDEMYMNMFFHKSSNRWVVNDAPSGLASLISSYSGKLGYIVEIEE